MELALEAVEDAPTIEPDLKWIPCSERLPEPYEHCLWTTIDGRVVYHHCDGLFSKYIAWMPLPEAYKGKRMKNADKFKDVFGLYATEAWSKPEDEFLKWLNAEYSGRELKWIPVSERLPEKPNVYTVTDGNGDVVRFVFYNNEASREYWRRCVKAWMPLPEPYKERRKDEKNRNQTEHTWRHKNSNESPDIL